MILVDTDVPLDIALDRAPHVAASAALIDQVERGGRGAFVAWHTLANLYYLMRPARGDADARTFLAELTRFITVAPTDSESFRYAAGLDMTDLEDAMQVAAAHACGATVIATRNLRDFQNAPIPAMTPAQLLAES